MFMGNGKFDFSAYDSDQGNSGFGRNHPRGMDLKPELPLTTHELIGIDLTHRIDRSDVGSLQGGGGAQGAKPGGGGTTFPNYTAGPANGAAGYNIVIEFKGTSWTQAHYDVFVQSADRLVNLIIGEIPNVTVVGKGGSKVVDDILITAELGNIDGSGGVLGQAGPTAVRTNGSLPATAQMKFDIVDVNEMGLAVFADVVMHEMAHSLGFGSIWSRLGLVTNGLFTGDLATQEYHDMGGTLSGVPVEQDGGSGTAGSHWDEETFGNELMTGYINAGENYFTAMSAASFQDLGYVITANYEAWADPGYIFV
jgi:leishmanolysin